MNYKHRINSGFAGCRLLAYAHDHCRNREVRLFLLPESDEAVGVADGTDAWIAPVSASLFSVNIKRLIEDLRAGKELPRPVKPDTGVRTRRKLLDVSIQEPAAPRRRVLLEIPTTPRSRRNVLI